MTTTDEQIKVPPMHGLSWELKGTALRGLLRALEQRGALPQVLARCSDETRSTAHAPPLPGTWVTARVVIELLLALERVAGAKATRAAYFEATRDATLLALRPILQGLLRVFGAGPATVFRRAPMVTQQTDRGATYEYVELAPRSGQIRVHVPSAPDVPWIAFEAAAGAWENVFLYCNVPGTVGEPVVTVFQGGTLGVLPVSW